MDNLLKLIIIALTLVLSEALECHLCMGSPNSDCAKGTATAFSKQVCQEDSGDDEVFGDNAKVAELQKKHFGEKIIPKCISLSVVVNGTATFTRACGMIYEKADLCEFMKLLADKVDSCKVCDGNMCNTS